MIFKIVVVGASKVGKTRLVESSTYTYPTVGVQCYRMVIDGDTFCVWDTSGDPKYSSLVFSMIPNASAVCVVYRDDTSSLVAQSYVDVVRKKAPDAIVVAINTGSCSMKVECDIYYNIDVNTEFFYFNDVLRFTRARYVMSGLGPVYEKSDSVCCCSVA